MLHRLRASTRHVATAVAIAAAAAAADVAHTGDGSVWAMAVAGALIVAAVTVLRLHDVAVVIGDDDVEVRNLLRTHTVPRADFVTVEPGAWRSEVVLADGSTIPTLIRAADLAAGEDTRERMLDLTAVGA